MPDINPGRINKRILFPLIGVLFIACMVLVGWVFNITLLKKGSPYFISMAPSAAFCLILVSLSIFINLKLRNFKLLKISEYLQYIVILICSINLIDFYFNIKVNIDDFLTRLISREYITDPHRMSEIAAIDFILLGISVLCLNKVKSNPLLLVLILLPILNEYTYVPEINLFLIK